MDALIFIDTNILLDFYRVRGSDAGLTLLDPIDQHHQSMITTSQVEMEYKKHRQRVIMESLKAFKVPDWSAVQVPAFLLEAKPAKRLARHRSDVSKQVQRIHARLTNVLTAPSRHDRVYQTAQRLFRSTGVYHLTREMKERREVRRLAFRRFLLGYPPRKPTDTSCGDAINWEWIVHCAQASGRPIVIVSRDSDYGVRGQDGPVLNDWLLQEFKERVSRKRALVLTDRLADAFKRASIPVTKRQAAEEKRLIEELKKPERPALDQSSPQVLWALYENLSTRIAEAIKATGETGEAPKWRAREE